MRTIVTAQQKDDDALRFVFSPIPADLLERLSSRAEQLTANAERSVKPNEKNGLAA